MSIVSACEPVRYALSALPSEHYAAFYRTRAAEIVESARVAAAEAGNDTDSDAPLDAEHAEAGDERVA